MAAADTEMSDVIIVSELNKLKDSSVYHLKFNTCMHAMDTPVKKKKKNSHSLCCT